MSLGILHASGCCGAATTTASFTREESPTTEVLRAVVRFDDFTAVAIGARGTVVSRDGSPYEGTWTLRDSGATDDLFSIAVPDYIQRSVLAVGANGTILRGSITGDSWTRIPSGVEADLHSVVFFSASEEAAIAVGDGVVLMSSDRGSSWAPPTVPGELGVLRAVRTIRFAEGTSPHWEILAVGDAGRGIFSRDGGGTWSTIDLKTETNLTAIANGVNRFTIYGDNGSVWHQESESSGGYLFDQSRGSRVQGIARSNLWLASADGLMTSTLFGLAGAPDDAEPVDALFAVDGESSDAIAVGEGGAIVRAELQSHSCP